MILNFNEALLYADSSKIAVKEGSRVLMPAAVGLNPADNTRLIIEIALIGTFVYRNEASTAYTVELAAGAVADLAGNLSIARYSRSQTTARTDTTKVSLNLLVPSQTYRKEIYINVNEVSTERTDLSKVSFYSVDGEKATKINYSVDGYDSFPGYRFYHSPYTPPGQSQTGILKIRYVESSDSLLPSFMPKGSYRLIFGVGALFDAAGNVSDEIVYNFTVSGVNTLALYDSNELTKVYDNSLSSTGAKNLTVKFSKAIKLPAGKKKQVFIEKKTGSSWNVVLNADGDFSTAVGTDEKNLVLSTRNNLAAGTYRLRVEMEAVQSKDDGEYLTHRYYTSEVTK